tara:strand:- start:64 stop:318 length:255 start_codon:yes stop_codon:yes gene_type:complete
MKLTPINYTSDLLIDGMYNHALRALDIARARARDDGWLWSASDTAIIQHVIDADMLADVHEWTLADDVIDIFIDLITAEADASC